MGGYILANDKILVSSNNQNYYYQNGWQLTGNTEQDFLNYGMDPAYIETIPESAWQELNDITLLYYTDDPDKTQVLFEVETEPYTFIEEMGDSVKVLYYTDNPEKEEAFIEFEPADKKFRNFTRYALSKDGRQNWYVYKDGKWLRINIDDIYEKGMTKEELEALTNKEFEKWFERGTLDFVIGLWKENEVEEQIISSMIFKFPENQGPTITNLHATPDTIHNEAITIKALIKDLEGDQVQYRILVNGRQVRGWRSVPFEYHVNQALFFSHDYFKVGNNIITIEAQDDRGALNSASTTVFVSNTIPKIIITKITDFAVEGCIGDDDSDKIQYRVLINGKQFYPTNKEWTDLKDSPITFRHSWTSKDIFVGQDNIIRIEFRDEYGQGGSWQGIIQGRYFNLMFKDEFGDYLSTDRGDILKILDMGSIIAGQTSFDYEVILENSTDMHVKDVHIYVDKNMLPQGVNIEFSRTRNPFIAEDDIRYDEPMEPQEMRSFYIRITTAANARYGGQFNLHVKGTPVL